MRRCDETPPGQLLQAMRQFNAQEWFECHETLEDLWIGEEGEARSLFQGILQIAIALHHWRNGNYVGAVSLFNGGVKLLSQVPETCLWVDVTRLIADATRMRVALEDLGKERMSELDSALIPRLRTANAENSESGKS